MRKSFHKNPRLWIFLLVGLALLMSSCNKEIDEDVLGPAKTINDMLGTFSEVVGSLDNSDISKNDWVFYFQKGMLLGNRVNAEIRMNVSVYSTEQAKCGEKDGLNFQYVETQAQKIDGKLEEFKWDRSACVSQDKNDLLFGYIYPLLAPSGVTNTFHNVKLDTAIERLPDGVVEQGCPGRDSCNIRVYNLEFYQKMLLKNGVERILYHQYKVSPDVPFLARDLSYCISQSVDLSGTPIAVKQCIEVRNFGQKNE